MGRYAISGGRGMIGTELAGALRQRGDEALVLTRGRPRLPDEIRWDFSRGIQRVSRLEGLNTFFNLTGAPIAQRPWTRARRKRLWESRVTATEAMLRSLERLDTPPESFVGVGVLFVHGDCGDRVLDEDSPLGDGFLVELERAWEGANFEVGRALGCRVTVLRMAVVLAPNGGMFPLMLKPFRAGIGGWLGNGRQYTSWISIRDAIGALLHLADTPELEGVFNGTVPEAVRNYEWCSALARVLGSRVMAHAPKWAVRGALGELADDVFLASVRATPRRLLESGYQFKDTDPEQTFRWLVGLSKG